MNISLDGAWQLYYFPEQASPAQHPGDYLKNGVKPVSAQVPGNVELDLHRAGVIPEPFYAENIRKLRPYEYYEWWYVREFNIPADVGDSSWELAFEGLDTIASVWINDVLVGKSVNALIPHRFEVTKQLKIGSSNRIVVRLGSAFNYARQFQYDAASVSSEGRDEALYVRKPPHSWGWDIMPRTPSAGIWRPVRLEQRPTNAIEQLYFWTAEIHEEGATLGMRYQFRTGSNDLDNFQLEFHGVCGEHTFDYVLPVEFLAGSSRIKVPGARLWWPRGYGEPNLYSITVQLKKNDQLIAERNETIGIRKIVVDRTEVGGKLFTPRPVEVGAARIDQEPDPESHFVFYVNNQPILVKGTNWVPLDAFHSRDRSRTEQAIELVNDLGCNMIRCWGGNVYESDAFFALCDANGFMVWQDFIFACASYPQTQDFLDEVRREVETVAMRLRNHPALAIWCGDNENDMIYLFEGLSPKLNRLTREIIPQTLFRCDPHREYVPSSPYVPPSVELLPDAWHRTPEQHLWGPRGYYKNLFYTNHNAHFIGEIGYHGCNNVSSIQKFISPEKVWPWQNNSEWHAHDVFHWQKPGRDRDRIQLMVNQVREMFGEVPDDLPTFALASQITQAEAKKFFIESTRMRKWQTSGIIWWNVLDGWPQFSDAVVDYYFAKKLAYYYIQRSQVPVCIMIGEAADNKYLPVVACNDSLKTVDISYSVRDAVSGETLSKGAIQLPPNQNWRLGRIRTYASDKNLYLIEWEVDGKAYGNHYLSGTAPHSLENNQKWLPLIAGLARKFDVGIIAK